MWNRSCFVAVTVGKFRVSGREVLLPVAADVFIFFASGGPLFPAAGKVGKRAGRNQRFLHFLPRYVHCKSDAACHTFTQIFLCRSVKGLSQQQRRCRRYRRRTTLLVLPSQRMSGAVKRSGTSTLGVQRRRREVSSSYGTTTAMFRERVVQGIKS